MMWGYEGESYINLNTIKGYAVVFGLSPIGTISFGLGHTTGNICIVAISRKIPDYTSTYKLILNFVGS